MGWKNKSDMDNNTSMLNLNVGDKVIVRVPGKFNIVTCSVLFFNTQLMFGGVYKGIYLGDASLGRNNRVLIENDDVIIVPKSWIEKNSEGE